MRKAQKQQAEELVKQIEEAHDQIKQYIEQGSVQSAMELLEDCQNGGIAIGTLIEQTQGEGHSAVSLLEEYCELVYQIHANLAEYKEIKSSKVFKLLRQKMIKIGNCIRNDIPIRTEAVFLPYKASMWDSLESVWKAADEDPNCDAFVIPIPYYDKNPDGSFREMHYEGKQYPDYVPITKYDEFDFEAHRPDTIYIHNPYDDLNYVTSVPPFFFSENLKKYTEKLVYIPYFVLNEMKPDDTDEIEGMKHFVTTPAVFNAHKVIVQSEDMKQVYMKVLLDATNDHSEAARKYWDDKILGLGSPKIDKVLNTKKGDLKIPPEWLQIIERADGSWKKIVFYNTSVGALLQYNEKMLQKMESVFEVFKGNQENVVLLWRPHPLIKATVESMRPQLWIEYDRLVRKYREEGWGIYDDSSDINRAIIISDAYYGDGSSVVALYKKTGKPIMIQNVEAMTESSVAMCNGTRVGNDWYFVSVKDNILYKMDLNTFMVEYVRYMPHVDELYLTQMGYTKLFSYKDKLILMPDLCKYIAVYHIAEGKVSYIEFGFKGRINGACFNGGVMLGDILFLLPCQYDQIVAFNMEKEIIEGDKSIKLPFICEKYTDIFSWGNFVQEKENVIFTSITQNKIVHVNLKTKKVDTLDFISNEPLAGIVEAGQYYWVFPMKGDRIIKINEKCETVQIIKSFPLGYVCGEWSFHMQHIVGNEIVLLPRLANKLLRMNKRTGEIREINISEDDYDEENYWDHYSRFNTLFEWEDKKILVETKTGRWIILNDEYEIIDTVELNVEQNVNRMEAIYNWGNLDCSLRETDGPIINIKNYICMLCGIE